MRSAKFPDYIRMVLRHICLLYRILGNVIKFPSTNQAPLARHYGITPFLGRVRCAIAELYKLRAIFKVINVPPQVVCETASVEGNIIGNIQTAQINKCRQYVYMKSHLLKVPASQKVPLRPP